ncbi:MAG TPA: hypothetical protein VM536_10045 [Chloroflexia bacterium]|nr:hypothetical protein [Chloroflexia bacterium]
MADNPTPEVVHRLPQQPVHLFQLNTSPEAYRNAMGCGAFSTSMALSVYDPETYGTYEMAREIFGQMLKVPVFGGTFENQNGTVARRLGFQADDYDYGTSDDLMAAIDLGAPVVILINPTKHLGIGTHDVLLVGYSVDASGACLRVFIDNPAVESGAQPAPAGLSYPGNQIIEVADLPHKWTGVFTPMFSMPEVWAQWRRQVHRG